MKSGSSEKKTIAIVIAQVGWPGGKAKPKTNPTNMTATTVAAKSQPMMIADNLNAVSHITFLRD
jgi:hypothetical protein